MEFFKMAVLRTVMIKIKKIGLLLLFTKCTLVEHLHFIHHGTLSKATSIN